ncbi:G2/mitotic-specific cyclin-2-like [Gossypium australe]|uniref:G2/mitotic-specific cyclin-2-like n=1 Tax=Gossypium australe TaxID=47621 RepID=A0A5B6UM94_9ROSI|nr:G2/mitotic-specific cyclin-2-like [Gossypium australe]
MERISDENNPNLTKPTNFQGCRKFGQEIKHNRRALSVINHNLVGAKAYPCVVNKRGLSQYTSLNLIHFDSFTSLIVSQ